jgi:hypothetical protein
MAGVGLPFNVEFSLPFIFFDFAKFKKKLFLGIQGRRLPLKGTFFEV